MVYGSKAILLSDLDYGAPRVKAYNEQGNEASLEDTMDLLNEACDVALLRSTKYQCNTLGLKLAFSLGIARAQGSLIIHEHEYLKYHFYVCLYCLCCH